MKIYSIALLLIIFIFFMSLAGMAQTTALTVNIENIKAAQGTIYINVFKDGASFPDGKPAYEAVLKCEGKGSLTASIPDVNDGDYAISVFQDLNGNGKLDKNFLGIPKEPYALSRNFHPKMSAPKFSDCKVPVSAANSTFNLRLIN